MTQGYYGERGIFDLVELIADRIEARGDLPAARKLRARFARRTGGADIPYFVEHFTPKPGWNP